MDTIERLARRMKPEERRFHEWQFSLARRIAQVLEERNLSQREFARLARLTDAQVSALLHVGANPTLSVLARISALLDTDLLTWTNSDTTPQSNGSRSTHKVKGTVAR